MRIQTVLIAVVSCSASIAFSPSAQADTVKARCDFYPKGEDWASASVPCTFSQRQGFITIRREDGKTYDFKPVGEDPGNFIDQDGGAVYRQSGLGRDGVIFRMPRESVFVYWDTAFSDSPNSKVTPTTYTTIQNDNEIAIQITEGEFYFWGILKRGETGSFVGSDRQVEVIFDPRTGQVIVMNKVTGDEFYNYYTTPLTAR